MDNSRDHEPTVAEWKINSDYWRDTAVKNGQELAATKTRLEQAEHELAETKATARAWGMLARDLALELIDAHEPLTK